MLYIDLVNTVLAKMRQDPITDLSTDTTTFAYRAQEAVNRAVARVWNHKTWAFKRNSVVTSLTSGTAQYELDRRIGEIYSIITDAHPYKISIVPQHLFNLFEPNPQNSGNPWLAFLDHFIGVRSQPSAASIVTAYSSSASDTTQTVLITGVINGGGYVREALSLSGTSQVSTINSFVSIESVTKSGSTQGVISIYADSGTTFLCNLAQSDTTARFKSITFFPTPSSTISITYHYFREPQTMVHKFEDSLIPDRWTYVVDQWAFALMLQSQGQDQLAETEKQTQLAIKMLEEDMASEETISVEESMTPLKVGEGGWRNQLMAPPSGTSFVD